MNAISRSQKRTSSPFPEIKGREKESLVRQELQHGLIFQPGS